MALIKTEFASSSGESHASSPEFEHPSPDMAASAPNASPISLPSTLLPTISAETDRDQRSSRSTPTRSSPTDLARSRSAGRGGCWYKCDEERVENDSCRTCRRLGIQCLGWGPRRPDWMRDKEKVAEYKAEIKAQLTRAGLIRGQPRAIYNALANPSSTVTSATTSTTSILPRRSSSDRFPQSAVAGPGPSTTGLRRSRTNEYNVYPTRYASSPHFQQSTNLISGIPGLGAGGATSDISIPSPFVVANSSFNHGSNAYTTTEIQSISNTSYPTFPTGAEIPQTLSPSGLYVPELPLADQECIPYYFAHVRKLQFVFAGHSLTDTLYRIASTDPQGALSYALRALASLHSTTTRVAHGLEAPSSPGHTVHKHYYDRATYILSNVKTLGGHYTEFHAIAAVYLISYHILSGNGGAAWAALLEVAYDWFALTGIHEEQNPKLMLVNMNAPQKLAAKATMWIDILSGVTFLRPPRFLSVYRRLFGGGGAGYWSTSNNDQLDLRMDKLTGCPDEALLAIAETAALAHWKASESRQGSLSMRDLIRRGDQIEQVLRQRPARNYAESPTSETVPVMPSGMTAAAGMFDDTTGPDETTRRTVAEIYRETAMLYLHTVLSDSHPGVPEINKSVNTLLDLIQQLGPSQFDRAVIFPLGLTGCMTADPFYRLMIKDRCNLHPLDFYCNGHIAQIQQLMEYVWTTRDSQRGSVPVDWRECLHERWSNLLMV
ncbi:hypothetical protein PHLCEN_2v1378 [Hermanssonia centrifuga]|uniref:Zn(2)-C6 fungal-type domain-containing protein n=1 Tax=Hermanssonia centrifuga TaxID=98765 RepID=A0A2R6S383_9APHY|nr:hypothetical protein PHLCEN_2v1378 [Hermanssonia centrifuga]